MNTGRKRDAGNLRANKKTTLLIYLPVSDSRMNRARNVFLEKKLVLPLLPSSYREDDPGTNEREDRGEEGERDPGHFMVKRHLDLRSLPGTEIEGVPVVLVSVKPYQYLVLSRRY